MPMLFQRLAWVPLRVLTSIFGSLEIRGVENAQKIKGPMVIASNHISELDPFLIVACFSFFSPHIPLFYVSREKGFYKKGWRTKVYGGTFFRMMGAYPAYTGLNDYEQALRHHLEIIKKRSVCIFPMGGIHLENEHAKAKGGVSYLAKTTSLPILPIRIQGLEKITFKEFFGGERKVIVTFGKPLYAKDIFPMMKKESAEGASYSECEKAATMLMEKISQLT